MNNSSHIENMGGQNKGIFIVIEGADGAGKSTQYQLLKEKLTSKGYDILDIHFPRYKQDSSYFVRQYLAGNYGGADEVSPYIGSLFYALDRYQASSEIKQAISEGKIVLCDRFVGSNMAHQGTKFDDETERRGYFLWLDNLEFTTLGIPRPDLNFVLNAPLNTVLERLESRTKQNSESKSDIHELNKDHIKKSISVYLDLCNLFPKDYVLIESERAGNILEKQEISKIIWEKIKPMLKPVDEEITYLSKNENNYKITEQGKEFLKEAVTSTTGNVYAFYNKLSPVTISAAMARLSRRGDDMRTIILDEFAGKEAKDENLLKRVITAYGDDSVQQLVGQHLVVENASNLLTKKLEWGRLASYLEQSTRYIYYDTKDVLGNYRYYTPEYFDEPTKQLYKQSLDGIFDIYSAIVRKLTDYIRETTTVPKSEQDSAWRSATKAQACDSARTILPVATTSTVGIYASGQALESLIMHLLSDELPEAKEVGQQILDESRKVISTFLERADKPSRGGAIIAYQNLTKKAVKEIGNKLITANFGNDFNDVTLSNYWPKNELDLVPDMLYEHSNLSLAEISQQVNNLSYQDRLDIFNSYIGKRLNRRQRPGRALEKAHYSWDIICDYGIFRDLQRHRMVDDLEWQQLTPRFGFEIPKIIEEAGLTDIFEQCFDISLSLYSYLQSKGYELEAQYATLLGHKMRWKLTYNAREAFHLHELRTSPQGHPAYRKLVHKMHLKLAEIHPLLASSMKFVNKDEDPELTRLASERYTQFKLSQS